MTQKIKQNGRLDSVGTPMETSYCSMLQYDKRHTNSMWWRVFMFI